MADASSAANLNDFLDDIVQSLFGAGLRLENCLHMLEDNSGNLRVEIDMLIEGLHELIGTIRLRAHGSAASLAVASANRSEAEVDGV